MLLSSLIDQLNDVYRVHGDLDVCVETDTEYEDASRVGLNHPLFGASEVVVVGRYA